MGACGWGWHVYKMMGRWLQARTTTAHDSTRTSGLTATMPCLLGLGSLSWSSAAVRRIFARFPSGLYRTPRRCTFCRLTLMVMSGSWLITCA